MGLLVVGTPLEWEEALQYLKHVREHGIQQFLAVYRRVKDISGDVLRWGDELEYHVLELDHEKKTVRLALRGHEILHALQKKEEGLTRDAHTEGCSWHPEYGRWMIEGTPSAPYGGFTKDLVRVEANLRLRRRRILANLRPNEICPTITAFPMMGVGDFTSPSYPPGGAISLSDYVPDACINPHPRFGTLTRNIRKRRGGKVDIRVPIYQDKYTQGGPMKKKKQGVNGGREEKGVENSAAWQAERARTVTHSYSGTDLKGIADGTKAPEPGPRVPFPAVEDDHEFVHMDCMAFGMGMCCLQVTFQAVDIDESRHLYDHLAVLAPLFLALTAATPILKGNLVDTDVRWATIAASVDDRTPQERGCKDLPQDKETKQRYDFYAGKGIRRLPKSRYESISRFICFHKGGSDPSTSLDKYNDIAAPYDEESFNTLVENGVDEVLAQHIAHLFIRDPLVIFSERVYLDDAKDTDHWENLQSTNWQTVRWKPPPPPPAGESRHPDIGWRVEFRTMETQLTDFENAAFTVFLVLVSRVILAFDLNLYIPLSKVDENLEIAHRRDAITSEKFWFRSHLAPPQVEDCCEEDCRVHSNEDHYELMTLTEILTGKGRYFPGLIPLVYAYLDHIKCDPHTKSRIHTYIQLIRKRASGGLMTAASWMRKFVHEHPAYKHDSRVSQEVAFDLMEECRKIGEGEIPCPELLGDITIDPIKALEPYEVYLTGNPLQATQRQKLVQRYLQRKQST